MCVLRYFFWIRLTFALGETFLRHFFDADLRQILFFFSEDVNNWLELMVDIDQDDKGPHYFKFVTGRDHMSSRGLAVNQPERLQARYLDAKHDESVT